MKNHAPHPMKQFTQDFEMGITFIMKTGDNERTIRDYPGPIISGTEKVRDKK
jgi:hypothetical protein